MPVTMDVEPYKATLRDEKRDVVAFVYSRPHAQLFLCAENMHAALRLCADALATSSEPWAARVLEAVRAALPKDDAAAVTGAAR